MGVFKKFFLGSVVVIINLVIGRAILAIFNTFGYYPSKWLTKLVIDEAPKLLTESTVWIISGVFAILLYVVELKFKLVQRAAVTHAEIPTQVDQSGQESDLESYISISEAGKSLYGSLREIDKDHWHVKMSESVDDQEDGILSYFAICISLHTEIFGKRPPSNKLEKIDHSEFKRGPFKNEGNEFWYYKAKKPTYIELVINSGELPSILGDLKSETGLEDLKKMSKGK